MSSSNNEQNQSSGDEDKKVGILSSAVDALGGKIKEAFSLDKIYEFGKSMVETTASVKELDDEFNQAFKNSGSQALALINKQADEQGISVDRLKGAWGNFYEAFTNNGTDANQSLDLTSKYMNLAADGAAYYNTSVEDVSDKLKSMAKGNYDAGEAIGLNIDATKLDTLAKEKYGKSLSDLSDTEREYLLIDTASKMYESSGVMGQAQKEANNYANVIENLKSVWQRFLSILGTPLLDGVVIVIKGITDVIEQLSAQFQSFDIGKFVSGIKSDIPGVGEIFKNLKDVFYSIKDAFVDIVSSIISSAKEWYDNNHDTIGKIVETFNSCMKFIKGIITDATTIITAIWDEFGKYIFGIAVDYLGDLLDNIKTILQVISGVFHVIASLIKGDWKGAWDGVKDIIFGALDYIKGIIQEKLIGAIIGKIEQFGNGIKNSIANTFNDIKSKISKAWSDISGNITNVLTSIKNNISKIWNDVSSNISKVITSIKNNITKIWNDVSSNILKVMTSIKNTVTRIWNDVSSAISKVLNTIKGIITKVWDEVSGVISKALNAIKNSINSVFKGAADIITNIFNGIKNGISAAWNSISTTTGKVLNSIKNTISNIFNGVKNTVSDIFNGIKDIVSKVWDSISSSISKVVNSIKNVVASVFGGIKDIAKTTWNGVKDAIWEPISKAQELLGGFVDKVKSWFTNLIPHIRLPHFTISGSMNPIKWLDEGTPKVNVEWYAEGGILTKPMPFGINPATGNIMAGGEASTGGEAILPLNKLPSMMADAIRQAGLGEQPIIININGKEVFNAMSPYMAMAAKRRR